MIDSDVTLLPQPDSPTSPSVRPAIEREAHAVDRGELAVVGREMRAQVANLEQRPLMGGSSCRFAAPAWKRAMFASITARSVMPAGLARDGTQARNGWKRSRLVSVQAAQLGDRFGVIVDAQIEERILLGGDDEQRGRLLAALVAARGLAGGERRQQALGERQPRARVVDARRFGEHLRARQHVAGDGILVAGDVAAPVDAGAAGVRGRAALAIDHVQLPRRRVRRRRR